MSAEDISSENTVPAQSETIELALFEAEANERIRKVWHDGRWFYSVIDIIALLTDSPRPGKYWSDMKLRITDEGFVEACAKCIPLKVRATDGKLRETDCADFATMVPFILTLPAIHRRADSASSEGILAGNCGIYAIVNTITHEHYIGSSTDITHRFVQHKALLRRGKHHASRLQEAWDIYGDEAFVLVIREPLPSTEKLEETEQQYIDEEQPVYNAKKVARNSLSLPPVSEERVQQVLFHLYEIQSALTNMPLFHLLREAIIYGIIKPGPKFAVLAQAEASGIDTWGGFGAILQRHQQAC